MAFLKPSLTPSPHRQHEDGELNTKYGAALFPQGIRTRGRTAGYARLPAKHRGYAPQHTVTP
ncbi:hypothetical protein E2C01_101441 [Portunus trituberculatus]|uniref:Uncharacterized protein n=1 Tax=Portunus trituberculatus TaxID=210409 RepID=A0A5B7KAR2_PORTR|nr:hypothetical protein [Portunus trituberculatus]